ARTKPIIAVIVVAFPHRSARSSVHPEYYSRGITSLTKPFIMMRKTLLVALASAFSALSGASAYVSTFVPKRGIVSGTPKSVTISNNGRASSTRNDIKMMPIGVPKVAYRVPGSMGAEWVDIYNRLYRERIIFLGSEIDDELANQIIGVLLYLDEEDSSKPIYLYINCPGGSVISGLAIFDAMQLIKSEVITINLGLAASMASFILAAGSKGKRLALPSSRIMIHQPMGGAQGQAQDIKNEAAQIMRIRDNLVKMYSMFTGQTTDQITKDLDRDNFMSAYEALEYGLIDRVLERTNTPGM
ncbi:hypothetical protein ACHAW6_014935, partial [Cyclotella cf. meneghiniana]